MSNVDKSIVFILDSKLTVLEHNSSVNESILLNEVLATNSKYLELSDHFDTLFSTMYTHVQTASNIIFLVATHAGFTDSRIIFNWIKSSEMFLNIPYFVLKLDIIDLSLIHDYVFQAIDENNKELVYLKEPSIG
jgi:hypothetical protein